MQARLWLLFLPDPGPVFHYETSFFISGDPALNTINAASLTFLCLFCVWYVFFPSIYFLPLSLFLKDFIYLFLERGKGRKKERERNISVWLPLMLPSLGTWPITQTCAPTGNQTRELWFTGRLSIHWAAPARAQPLSSYSKCISCKQHIFGASILFILTISAFN